MLDKFLIESVQILQPFFTLFFVALLFQKQLLDSACLVNIKVYPFVLAVSYHRLRNRRFFIFFGYFEKRVKLDVALLKLSNMLQYGSQQNLRVPELVLPFDFLKLMIKFDTFILSVDQSHYFLTLFILYRLNTLQFSARNQDQLVQSLLLELFFSQFLLTGNCYGFGMFQFEQRLFLVAFLEFFEGQNMGLPHSYINVALLAVEIFQQNQRAVEFRNLMIEVPFPKVEFSNLLHFQEQFILVMQPIIEVDQSIENINKTHGIVVGASHDLLHQVTTVTNFGLEPSIKHKQVHRFLQWKSFANFECVDTVNI